MIRVGVNNMDLEISRAWHSIGHLFKPVIWRAFYSAGTAAQIPDVRIGPMPDGPMGSAFGEAEGTKISPTL